MRRACRKHGVIIALGVAGDGRKVQWLLWALRDANDVAEAKQISDRLERMLKQLNMSEMNSYLEVKDDRLVIRGPKLSKKLKRVFSTTNQIESLSTR